MSAELVALSGKNARPLRITHISAELAPIAKVGGLADVVSGLAREHTLQKHDVSIILPKYDCMDYTQIQGLLLYQRNLAVPWYQGFINCTVWSGTVNDTSCYFIDAHSDELFFNRGLIYGHHDDVSRFAFFCRAAMEFLYQNPDHPDIIHCHDWQAGLIPVLLYEIYQPRGMSSSRVCYTIHNFHHQGWTGEYILAATGLNHPEHFCREDRLLDDEKPYTLNLVKAGIVYSNYVTTVSPRYAEETRTGPMGQGLQRTLQNHHMKYRGVLNGIDYKEWNPSSDPHIPIPYDQQRLDNKKHNRQQLRKQFQMEETNAPLVAFIGRLDPQKGLELVRHALFYCLEQEAQFILLGTTQDPNITAYFQHLREVFMGHRRCHLALVFNDSLAHRIYAAADIILVPSQFEPCGLTQLIAMRYGTIPVVRSVGGLADTVHDKHYATIPAEKRNGFTFENYDETGINSALSRALDCYSQQSTNFDKLIQQAMQYDYSWHNPAHEYESIYHYIRTPD